MEQPVARLLLLPQLSRYLETSRNKEFILRRLFAIACTSFVLVAASCGDSSEKFPQVQVIQDGVVTPVFANSEIVVGQNRMAFGILDKEGAPVVDAKVHLVFYELNGGQTLKRFEMDAMSRVPARDAGIKEQVQHAHIDGSRHTHVNAGEEIGVYTAVVTFDNPGDWGVELQVESSRPKFNTTLRPRFNVLPAGSTPPVGSPAPLSRNLTVSDVADLSQIDSSANPSSEMHTSTIAAAVAAGRPSLVLFAVPGYCSSRLCGPELEIMRKLYPRYRDKAEFIHVEFYKNPGDPDSDPVETVVEWNLRTEPWFFVIDGRGFITAKFEGPTSLQELEEALNQVVK